MKPSRALFTNTNTIAAATILLALTACDRSDSAVHQGLLKEWSKGIEKRLAALEAATNRLDVIPINPAQEYSLNLISNQLNSLHTDFLKHALKEKDWITLDPAVPSFQRIETSILPLFVAVKEFTPYLDGYKVTIQLGNPHATAFRGFQLNAEWGNPFMDDAQKRGTYSMVQHLKSGAWTDIQFTIAPAGTGDVRNVRIRITPNEILLN